MANGPRASAEVAQKFPDAGFLQSGPTATGNVAFQRNDMAAPSPLKKLVSNRVLVPHADAGLAGELWGD